MIDELHAVFYKSLLNGYESQPGPPSDAMIIIISIVTENNHLEN